MMNKQCGKIKTCVLLTIALFLFSGCNSLVTENEVFTPETLGDYGVASWFSEGKLGLFMHLSAYSVPAFMNEWYPHNIYYVEGEHKPYKAPYRAHHEKTYGSLKEFGYKDFIPQLTLDKFDADYYARLAKRMGVAYFAAPAIHHDGFAMWNSEQIEWNSVKMGPKRDVVKELLDAMKNQGIKTGISTHYGRHWAYYTFRPEFDTWDPNYEGLYGKRRGDKDPPRIEDALKWERVMVELIDNYQPDYTFVDGGICDAHTKYKTEIFREALYRLTAYYYTQSQKWGKDVVLTWKRDAMKIGEAIYDTEGKNKNESGIAPIPWQSHISIKQPGWCYTEGETMLDVDVVLTKLIDVVSRNGNLLVNIGPRADGILPVAQEKVVMEIGRWMTVNDEGITGTRPWKIHGVGEVSHKGIAKDSVVRFTQSKDGRILYAARLGWPKEPFTLTSFAADGIAKDVSVKSISLLGSKGKIKWERTKKGITITPPSKPVLKNENWPVVFKLVIK